MKFDKLIATGGIGSGMIFQLEGDHTLLREESRLGRLTDYKDYCKGHIITHYVAQLSGARCFLLGKIGMDTAGQSLLQDMTAAGIDTGWIEPTETAKTMLSVCYLYPDGSGGNITTSNSACNLVDAAFLCSAAAQIGINDQTVVLAAPEVPLVARQALLAAGRAGGGYTVASFLAEELPEALALDIFSSLNLLALNDAEMFALGKALGAADIDMAARLFAARYPDCHLIVTAGGERVSLYTPGGERQDFFPKKEVQVVSSAGAGDALLGTLIAGVMRGLSVSDALPFGLRAAEMAIGEQNSISWNVTTRAIGL